MINSKELLKYTQELTILYVEDYDELRNNTSEVLNNFFSDVVTAENGQVALELYKKSYADNNKTFDIVLSDIQMPFLDGVELTKEIYALNPQQTIIIVSAYDESKYLLPLINLGIDYFVKKPIDFQELFSVLLNSSKKIISTEYPQSHLVHFSEKYFFNKDDSSLYCHKENIYLTKYEIIFLQILTMKIGKIYSNEDITLYYDTQDEKIDAKNIRKLVSKLRKKLPENTIESIYGVGYKIIQDIENSYV